MDILAEFDARIRQGYSVSDALDELMESESATLIDQSLNESYDPHNKLNRLGYQGVVTGTLGGPHNKLNRLGYQYAGVQPGKHGDEHIYVHHNGDEVWLRSHPGDISHINRRTNKETSVGSQTKGIDWDKLGKLSEQVSESGDSDPETIAKNPPKWLSKDQHGVR